MAAYTNASAQYDLSNDELDNKYRTFSNKKWFISFATTCFPKLHHGHE